MILIKFVGLSLNLALPLLRIALSVLLVSFTATLYMALHTKLFWLGVVVLVVEGVFLGAFLVHLFISFSSSKSCSRNKVLR